MGSQPPAPDTRRWWIIGTLLVALATAGIVWLGIQHNVGAVRVQVTGYKVLSESEVRVEYDVHRPGGEALVCTAVAQDQMHARVGAKDDEIPAGPETSLKRTVVVRTSHKAVTGLVESCVRV